MAGVVDVVFLVEGPADALDGAALDLAFHIGRVDGLAGVLDGGVAHNVHFAGVLVNGHINNVDADAGAGAAGVDAAAPDNGAAGRHLAGRQLPEGQTAAGHRRDG